MKKSEDGHDLRNELAWVGIRQRRLRRTVFTLAKGMVQSEGLHNMLNPRPAVRGGRLNNSRPPGFRDSEAPPFLRSFFF